MCVNRCSAKFCESRLTLALCAACMVHYQSMSAQLSNICVYNTKVLDLSRAPKLLLQCKYSVNTSATESALYIHILCLFLVRNYLICYPLKDYLRIMGHPIKINSSIDTWIMCLQSQLFA